MRNLQAVALGPPGDPRSGPIGGRVRSERLSPSRQQEIARQEAKSRWRGALPESLRPLFWSHPRTFHELTLDADLNLVMYQVLAYGSHKHKAWLVRRVGDSAIRRWLLARRGGGLTPEQMRPWVSERRARQWLSENPGTAIWANR